MCYCNCEYERFNPMTGDCKCTNKGTTCPTEEEYTCVSCGMEITEEQYSQTEDEYDGALCCNCVEDEEA